MAQANRMSLGNILVWILLALLIVGLAGFGATSFGSSRASIATVGDREIDAERYFRAASQRLRELQARGFAITASSPDGQAVLEDVRASMVDNAALENETLRIGLSVSDAVVAQRLVETGSFTGIDGSFDRTAYEAAISRAGMRVADFENDLRIETARDLLQVAVAGDAALPDTYVDTLMTYIAERRDVRLIRFTPADLPEDLREASEADLRSYYEANPERFTLPARRQISYAWVTPDMLFDTVEVAEDDLRALYEQRAEEFNQPERRIVDRLIFADDAAAQAALARLQSGEIGFEDLVAERGLSIDDIGLGEVSRADLGPAADIVFALNDTGVAGPAPTDLGPALFRVNAIFDPVVISFDQARAALRGELALDRARRQIDDRFTGYEDLLASGATLEELARDTDLEFGTLEWWPEMSDGVAGYDDFRQAARDVTLDSFPEMLTLDDGGVFALRLDAELEPSLQPFDAVRDAVATAWRQQRDLESLRAQARAALAQMDVGGTLEAAGRPVETFSGLTREDFVPGAPFGFVERMFAAEPGERFLVEGAETVVVAVLDAIAPPDDDNPQVVQMRQLLSGQIDQTLAADLSTLFARAMTREAGISFDQRVINAVHAELP